MSAATPYRADYKVGEYYCGVARHAGTTASAEASSKSSWLCHGAFSQRRASSFARARHNMGMSVVLTLCVCRDIGEAAACHGLRRLRRARNSARSTNRERATHFPAARGHRRFASSSLARPWLSREKLAVRERRSCALPINVGGSMAAGACRHLEYIARRK